MVGRARAASLGRTRLCTQSLSWERPEIIVFFRAPRGAVAVENHILEKFQYVCIRRVKIRSQLTLFEPRRAAIRVEATRNSSRLTASQIGCSHHETLG